MRSLFKFYKIVAKGSKSLILTSILRIILTSIQPIYVYALISILIEFYDRNTSFKHLLLISVSGITCYILILIVNKKCELVIENQMIIVESEFEKSINKIILEVPYSLLEDAEFLDYKESALSSIYGRKQGIVESVNNSCIDIISSIITIGITAWILIEVNLVILGILLIVVIINIFMEKRVSNYEVKNFEKWIPLNRRLRGTFDLLYDAKYAKDIRAYKARDLFESKVNAFNDDCINLLKEETKVINRYNYFVTFITYVQMLITYFYMVVKILEKTFTISVFPIYIGALNNFSRSFINIGKSFVILKKDTMFLNKYISFIKKYERNLDVSNNVGLDEDIIIEFNDVCFKYPNSNNFALENVNVKFKLGRSYSIVGMNGSGKTTMIKLLQKVYIPTSGTITVNGIDINDIADNTYYKLFSTVFQDFNIFSLSLEENISALANTDIALYDKTIALTGIDTLLKSSKIKSTDRIFKIFDDNGIILSGGQLQKIAISRALYKESKFIIFDEATSALDAKYESDFLNTLSENTSGRGVVFITHRLNSCLFTDYVIFMKDGNIFEMGTHNELYNNKSEYYEMYNKQLENYT